MSSSFDNCAQSTTRYQELVLAYLDQMQAGGPVDRQAFIRRFGPVYGNDKVANILDELKWGEELKGDNVTGVPEHRLCLELTSFENYDIPKENHLGSGGLNSVHRVIDRKFGRPLALKVPLARFVGDAEVCAHLLREASICARLQHPSIVPIYDTGAYREGCPYFTMKLVEGRTLLAMLAARSNVTDKLIYFLGVFRQVCDAVAHAHRRNVIHLDLKPDNIMVGDFNEVHVMDWGFARELGDQSSAVLSRLQTLLWASQMHQVGNVFGTLAYMAPEQAGGTRDALSGKTDVFGLGGILCHILTGRPVYVGHPPEVIRNMAAHAKTGEALQRLKQSGQDRELMELVRQCLERDPAVRPTARDLASRVNLFLARMQEAKLRAERKAKWLIASLATLTAFIAAGTTAWYEQDRRARHKEELRQQETRADEKERAILARQTDVRTALGQFDHLVDRELWSEALGALERAEGRLTEGDLEEEAGRMRQARLDWETATGLLNARVEFLNLVVPSPTASTRSPWWNWGAGEERVSGAGYYDYSWSNDRHAELFRLYGVGCDPKEAWNEAKVIVSSSIRRQLIAGLDAWASVLVRLDNDARATEIFQLAALADTDSWRKQVREALLRKNAAVLKQLANGVELLTQPPGTILLLSEALDRLREPNVRANVLLRYQESHPDDAWVNGELAAHFLGSERGRNERAMPYARVAVALRPQSAVIQANLGAILTWHTYSIADRYDDSLEDTIAKTKQNEGYKEGQWHCRRAIELAPEYPYGHLNLGMNYLVVRRFADAVGPLKEYTRLRPNDYRGHSVLALAFVGAARFKEAQASIRAAGQLLPFLDSRRAEVTSVSRMIDLLIQIGDNPMSAKLSGDWFGIDGEQRRMFARGCHQEFARYGAAARFYAEALNTNRNPYEVVIPPSRSSKENGIEAAARAVNGEGMDAARLSATEKGRLASLALSWLDEDLMFIVFTADMTRKDRRIHAGGTANPLSFSGSYGRDTKAKLERWIRDPGLQGLRDPAAVAKLPERERERCKRFWSDVRAVLRETNSVEEQDHSSENNDRIAHIETGLPLLVAGKIRPRDNAERLQFADLAFRYREHYVLASRLYRDAFKEAPGDKNGRHFDAACAAVLAANGLGFDAPTLDDSEKRRWRQQALDWLRESFRDLARQAARSDAETRHDVRRTLQLWQRELDLQSVRDARALEQLRDSERADWSKLWTDVERLIADVCKSG